MAAHERAHGGPVGDVDLDQLGVPHRGAMALAQVVENDHAVAGAQQRQHHVASDVAGAAGDEDRVHGLTLAKSVADRKDPHTSDRGPHSARMILPGFRPDFPFC